VALDGVDFAVRPGEVHALVGENGAGKSTLMKVVSGAYRADAGSMFLDGLPYHPRNPMDARRSGVAMIYQELSLAPHLSVEANVMLGVEPAAAGFLLKGEGRRRTQEALARLGHPWLPVTARVGSLSMAERQIAEVARAVAVGCRVLVLDEPTSSLARDDVERVFRLIQRLKAQGLAIVYISHFIEEVKQVADRLTVLRDGGAVGTGATPDMSIASIVSLMVGRDVADMYVRSERVAGETVLDVSSLSGFGKPSLASLELRRGEVVGLAGLVGAGRTELMRAIFGLERVRSGSVKVGVHTGPGSPVRRWAQGVGFLSEDRKGEGLAASMSIADNVTLSRLTGFGPGGLIFAGRQASRVRRWVDRLGIRCRSPRQAVGELSGGNQQKVALARLLQHDVDVLLLDEPTRGIDVGSKATIYEVIDELAVGDAPADFRPRAVLMVSSYLPELLGVCDRIAVMCRGVLGEARPVDEWTERSLLAAATGQEGLS
jgi:ribose transport system ATP-binding protein